MDVSSSAFIFDIRDIPLGPVTYPPGEVLESQPATSDSEQMDVVKDEKDFTQQKVQSILKDHVMEQQSICKTLRWSTTNTSRVVMGNNRVIDGTVQEGQVYQFFKQHHAINEELPGGDDADLSVWSRDPEDVREIKKIRRRKTSIKDMSDRDLLKYYHRLNGKQMYVFCRRSPAFQRRVKLYIDRYKNELLIRNLIKN